ncbi:MAG: cysteine desulfurase-like protein [Chloroflexi bacterium]|nr:cysteine desulfurase-like protein [Chloroflexota bacterium]
MTVFDPSRIRDQFPALALEQDGRPVIYLDGPGGTQVPQRVIDAVSGYYRTMNANDGGPFLTSRESAAMVAGTRAAVADLLGAGSPDEVHLGANMTTLTFHLSRSIGASLGAGDEVVVTTLDHEANVSPWRALAGDRDLVVRTVDIRSEDGTLDLDSLAGAMGPRTRLVAVGMASNALGTINPVTRIAELAHARGALVFVDAVHSVPHRAVDVMTLGADLLVTSPYKWFAPHAGVLWARPGVIEGLPAYKVRPARSPIATGTPAFELIAGVGAAIDYLADLGLEAGPGRRQRLLAAMGSIEAHETALSLRFMAGVAAIPELHLWGIRDPARVGERTPTFGLTSTRRTPHEMAEALGRVGIFAWDGHFYAQALIERLGLAASGGLLRIGFVHYNTAAEVDRTLDALEAIIAGGAPA